MIVSSVRLLFRQPFERASLTVDDLDDIAAAHRPHPNDALSVVANGTSAG